MDDGSMMDASNLCFSGHQPQTNRVPLKTYFSIFLKPHFGSILSKKGACHQPNGCSRSRADANDSRCGCGTHFDIFDTDFLL